MSTPPATSRIGAGTVGGVDLQATSERLISPEISVEAAASPQYWESGESYTATLVSPASMSRRHRGQTVSIDWESILRAVTPRARTVWDSPRLQHLLAQPLGSPVDLTDEEAEEIVRLAAGRRPDLRPGRDYVRYIRTLLGHSIVGRRKGGR